MRRLRILLALLLAILLLGVFAGLTVSAEEPTYFEYVITDSGGSSVTLLCCPLETDPASVRVKVDSYSIGSSGKMDLVIPDVIHHDGTAYTVVSLGQSGDVTALPSGLLDCLNTLSVGEHLRELHGNLFVWNSVSSEYFSEIKLSGTTNYSVPDTQTVLSNVKPFITEHYNDGTGHAYYAGTCLVRVDPAFTGNFTVRDGTICILAGAFEGCTGLKKVTIPDSVEFIGTRAFANSGVTEVTLPAGLSEHCNRLENFTFWNCPDLKTVSTSRLTKPLEYANVGCFAKCGSLTGIDFSMLGQIRLYCFYQAFDPLSKVAVSLYPSQISDYGAGQFAGSGVASVKFLSDGSEYPRILTEAFRNCKHLTEVDLGPVQSIYAAAFEGCTALTEDPLADPNCKVTYLSYRCFANTGLTVATFPATLTSMDGGIFADNPGIETVDWYSQINYYETPIFALLNDCSQGYATPYATKTRLGSSNSDFMQQPEKNGHTFVKTLNIYGCVPYARMSPYLEEVNFLNESITSIPEDCFIFCPALKTVTFAKPEALQVINPRGFAFCPGLNSFPFDQLTGLTRIGRQAFQLDGYDGSYTKEDYAAMAETDFRRQIGLSGTLDLSKCTSLKTIGNEAFQMQLNVTELDLPANLDRAGDDTWPATFYGMISLKTVNIYCPLTSLYSGPQDLFAVRRSNWYVTNYLGNTAGHYNDVIETIYAPNAGQIPYGTYFGSMSALKSITLGGTEEFPSVLFVNDISLEEVHAPDVKTVGDICFFGCTNLREVDLPKAETLKSQSFISCGIKELSLPSVKTIGYEAFFNCRDLELVSLPNLETIQTSNYWSTSIPEYDYSNTFMQCGKLRSVNLGKVTEIPRQTFMQCGLEAVSLSEGVVCQPLLLQGCANLKTLIVEEGVTELGDFLCTDCTNLKNVVLPSTLKTINWAAFKHCGSFTVVLPEGLETIEDDAFARSAANIIISAWNFEVHDRHDSASYAAYVESEEPLKAFGPDCTIYYTDDPDQPGSVKEKAEAWIELNYEPDEDRPAVLPLPESCELTVVYDGPALLEQGEPLPTDSLTVSCGGVELEPEEYTVDFEPDSERLGTRIVTVTANDISLASGTYGALCLAEDFFGQTVSAETCTVETPCSAKGQFTVDVYGWSEPVYTWDETDMSCTASHFAVLDKHQPVEPEKLVSETVVAESEVLSVSTCQEHGQILYTAVFTDPAFETQTMLVELPLAHLAGNSLVTVIRESTCVTHGIAESVTYCSVCGELIGAETIELPLRDAAHCPGRGFVDMPAVTHWAHEAIDWAIEEKITKGTSSNTFSPDESCTRAQALTFLWRAMGSPEPNSTQTAFTDLKEKAYYYKAVLWGVENGITNGTSGTTFSPNDTCTRAQIMTFLWRAMGSPEPTITESSFTDVPPRAYYRKAVLWAVEQGITEGTSAASFNPKMLCSRAHIVTFLFRALNETETSE